MGSDVPPDAAKLSTIAEIVPTEEQLKRSARARFKSYRDDGIDPQTINV
jgi:DNA polymerase-3 subunit chi